MIFFEVTKTLFSNIFGFLGKIINFITPIIGGIAIILVLLTFVGFIGSKNRKKYVGNNFILFLICIIIEFFISLFFFSLTIVKINLFIIIFCIMCIVLKLRPKKKKKKKEKTDSVIDVNAKVVKTEEIKENDNI